jgi:raffinose/stachyose/melibiose transport system permease protein
MVIKSERIKRNIIGYIMLIPALIATSMFVFYPIINSIVMSFTNWTGFSNNYKYVGLENYKRLFTKTPEYWHAIGVNLRFAITTTIIQTIIGFVLAFVLYNMSKKMQNFYKTALYLPVILPAAMVAVMWAFIFTPDYGLINQFLNNVGLHRFTRMWLSDYSTVMGSVVFVNTWRYVGITMILYFVAMNAVTKEILESAAIDGATKFKQLIHIFLPLTWNTTEVNILLSIIGGMKSFDLFFLLTGGGPGNATQVVGIVIYRTAFIAYRFSRALSMSVVLFIIILILTIISKLLMRRKALDEI